MKIIDLVGNDANIFAIREQLEKARYAVRLSLMEAAFLTLESHLPATLILIDTSGSDEGGLLLLRRVRPHSSLARVPVVMMSATASEEIRVAALELGATMFIVKPISPRELVVRIAAVLRSVARGSTSHANLADADRDSSELEIDNTSMTVSVKGRTVATTTLEFRLVEYLARHQGRVFTRDELLDAVWGETRFVTPRSVDACIRRVRKKLEPDRASPTYLKAIRGVGYRLDVSVPHGARLAPQMAGHNTNRVQAMS